MSHGLLLHKKLKKITNIYQGRQYYLCHCLSVFLRFAWAFRMRRNSDLVSDFKWCSHLCDGANVNTINNFPRLRDFPRNQCSTKMWLQRIYIWQWIGLLSKTQVQHWCLIQNTVPNRTTTEWLGLVCPLQCESAGGNASLSLASTWTVFCWTVEKQRQESHSIQDKGQRWRGGEQDREWAILMVLPISALTALRLGVYSSTRFKLIRGELWSQSRIVLFSRTPHQHSPAFGKQRGSLRGLKTDRKVIGVTEVTFLLLSEFLNIQSLLGESSHPFSPSI